MIPIADIYTRMLVAEIVRSPGLTCGELADRCGTSRGRVFDTLYRTPGVRALHGERVTRFGTHYTVDIYVYEASK